MVNGYTGRRISKTFIYLKCLKRFYKGFLGKMDGSETSDDLELGGSIVLSGFSGLDGASMIIVKKIVGNYAKRFSEICENFDNLRVYMKKIDNNNQFELNANVSDKGKSIVGEVTDRNLFFALDKVLKKVENGINK